MEYTGMNTVINQGERFVGNYQLISSNLLDVFKRHGNMVVSIKRLDYSLRKIAKEKFGKGFGIIYIKPESIGYEKMFTFVEQCMNELLNELKELSGYSNITYRKLSPHIESESEPICLIFEGYK